MSMPQHSEATFPGPRTRALLERRQRAVPRGVSHTTPIFVREAHGAEVIDVDGRRYLDFAGGIGVMNVGHAQPEIVRAVQEQAARFTHVCFQVAMYEAYVAVAEWLNRRTPGTHAKKTLLLNSGAEAVENAIKIARAATGRPAVIAFENAFHGRTLFTLSLTGKVTPYKTGFAPFHPDVHHVPYPDPYRNPFPGAEDLVEATLDSLRRLMATRVPAEQVAAVIVEPVQGEGGFIVPPPGFLRRLGEFCRERGILLVIDEIQTGFGRTGRLFACEHDGVVPDLIVTAKSIAAGLPLSAVTGRAEVMDVPAPGGLGGTYAGNPVACAAALEVFRRFEDGQLVARAARIGDQVLDRFRAWQARWPVIGHVRGLGAMVAMEFVKDPIRKEPAPEAVDAIVRHCAEHGLIVLKAGMYGNVIRFLAPLTITDEQLEEGLRILEEALSVHGG